METNKQTKPQKTACNHHSVSVAFFSKNGGVGVISNSPKPRYTNEKWKRHSLLSIYYVPDTLAYYLRYPSQQLASYRLYFADKVLRGNMHSGPPSS